MKQKIFFLTMLICMFLCNTTHAQFYNSFKLTTLETESAAIEMDNGLVFGFTETNTKANFHDNILLIKTNRNGNIAWSKKYDAGTGNSVHLMEMSRTLDNGILISGIAGPDNNFNGSKRCILKLNAKGNLIWAKKYSSTNPFDSKGLVELKDSFYVFSLMTTGKLPAAVRINNAGTVLAAMQINNKAFQSINCITATDNTADIVVENNIANINFQTGTLSVQRQYNTSNQFTSLLSTRCNNGDKVFLAGRTAGGTINGNSRLFRTTASGKLLWAKNIDAFTDSLHSMFSRFDIISQAYVREDMNGNIVVMVMAESTQTLMIVFSSAGKYLYHHLLYAPFSFIKETTVGSYLHSAAASNNTSSGNAIISNRFLSTLSDCDSTIFVKITNGTDSSTVLNKLIPSSVSIHSTDISLFVKDTTIQPDIFCNLSLSTKVADQKIKIDVAVLPNPATTTITVKTNVDLPFIIYSIAGELKIKSTTNHLTNISTLQPGAYMINVLTKDGVIKKMMIKR